MHSCKIISSKPMKLSQLHTGQEAVIIKVAGHGGFRKRIMEMGFVRGQVVRSEQNSPLNDPVKYNIMGYDVSLRRSEAAMIEVLPREEADLHLEPVGGFACNNACAGCSIADCAHRSTDTPRRNEINVALVGNPNSGKTSLFNALSGSSEHVGNYSGVTVDAKRTRFSYKGYRINLTDLPGTYSLSAYSPEEVYVRHHLYEQMPDVIVNAVVASNLERNLFLTTELIDLNQRTVVALNMYDELQAEGAVLDYRALGAMVGIPMIPTIAKNGYGLTELLDTIIELFEGRNSVARHVHISYGGHIEEAIRTLSDEIRSTGEAPKQFPIRYWALKMLEGDKEAMGLLKKNCPSYPRWEELAKGLSQRLTKVLGADVEGVLNDRKYGFIAGALEETLQEGNVDTTRRTRRIDRLVANKWLGFPIFIILVWLMFYSTFALGAYPQGWIESAFEWLGDRLWAIMPAGALRDLVVNGIIGGVGSVAVFLPNILILYLFISLMEDSGYMARAAFIMDRLMHRMGLHGKSFIPLIMGFGCNVPAIMAARTIESRSSRLITILVTPFMSCSARLPVFILLAGTFFPRHAATVLIGLYLGGMLVAFLTAKLLRLVKFKKDETPFVMELPPYRWPTLRATLQHMWDKCAQYVRKIGTTILLATVVIWFLSYFPRPAVESTVGEIDTTSEYVAEANTAAEQFENSFMGRMGKAMEPVMRPLGLDWRASAALITSIPAKELVVSTMAVLYGGENRASLSDNIITHSGFTPRSALSFMVFILLFFPCIATLATIKSETGSRGWMWFTLLYNTAIAWLLAWVVYII